MNRRERDNYDYDRDYSSNPGYSRDDEHYHSARNLTNEFEQRYQRARGHRDDAQDHRMNNPERRVSNQNQYRREENDFSTQRTNRDQSRDLSGSYTRDRDRFRDNQNDYRREQEMTRRHPDDSRDRSYGTSRFENTAERYSASGNEPYRRPGREQQYNAGLGDGYQGSRYGGNSEYLSGRRGSSSEDRNYGNRSGSYTDYDTSRRSSEHDQDRRSEHTAPNTYRRFVE